MTDISALGHLAAAGAALAAGTVNAIAGGGTLISFPALTAIGVPTVHAQRDQHGRALPRLHRRDVRAAVRPARPRAFAAPADPRRSHRRSRRIDPADHHERGAVPHDRAVPDPRRVRAAGGAGPDAHLAHARAPRRDAAATPRSRATEVIAVAGAAVYGGYFGAGLGIMIVAVLGLISDRPFVQLNAVKLLLAFVINIFAAAFLVFSGKVEWTLVLVMAPCALARREPRRAPRAVAPRPPAACVHHRLRGRRGRRLPRRVMRDTPPPTRRGDRLPSLARHVSRLPESGMRRT